MYFAKGIIISQVKCVEVQGKKYYSLATLIGEKDKDGFYDPKKVEVAVVRSQEPILEGKTFKYGQPVLLELDVTSYEGQTKKSYSNPQLIASN